MIIALWLAPSLHAAVPTGSISGRVQNVVTGQYLTNARVAVQGTEQEAFTDQTGSYRLASVPSGPVVLEVFYTGLDPRQIPVTIRAGEVLEQDVSLTSTTRYGAEASGTVKLDAFVVATARETDGAAIAINEQRFSPNIKNVIAADALGDVMDGNVGEFLKFMPGMTAEYDRESGGDPTPPPRSGTSRGSVPARSSATARRSCVACTGMRRPRRRPRSWQRLRSRQRPRPRREPPYHAPPGP